MSKSDGFKFLCELPAWADGRERICHFKNEVIITHPNHPPYYYNRDRDVWVQLEEVKPNEIKTEEP